MTTSDLLPVGTICVTTRSIYEPADDYAPGGYLCHKGDRVVVIEHNAGFNSENWPYAIRHTNRHKGGFLVETDAITEAP